MDFAEQLKQFISRIDSLKNAITTEEATKTSLIMPFFAMLGYDVFNPSEFMPEFTADVGIKKGEKVDYAIIQDGIPTILIEAKSITEKLDKHGSQLFRYFGTTKAKFGILTNGIVYKFYTDLEETNKMDKTPFLEINLLDLKDSQIIELKKFQKTAFDIDMILTTASDLKYTYEIKKYFDSQLQNPSDDFVKLFINDIYSGMKTQTVIEKFRPIVKKSLSQFVSEKMNEKIKNALGVDEDNQNKENEKLQETFTKKSKIITTQEELEGYFIIKNVLKEYVSIERIAYRDAETYFAVLLDDNNRKWICRLILKETQKVLIIPDENKKDIKISIDDIYDIEKYKDKLLEVVKRYL